jgi:hypothetical protein
MRGSGQNRISARAERRAIIALLAIFALLVQAFMPMAAVASTGIPGDTICVAHGVQAAPGDQVPAKGTPAHPCEHACCPASVSATPPGATQLPEAIAYGVSAPSLEPRPSPTPGRGLAAPPPPSQGPPRLRS